MKKLSLVLPVYNVEKYLSKCIFSCLHQDIPCTHYEIIIVSDGSTDNSLNIAREFEAKYSNILVIEQENSGLSGARNTGLRHAKGEYVWFIDSDDWIEKDCLKLVTERLTRFNPDTLVINYYKVNQLKKIKSSSPVNLNFSEEKVYSGLEYFANRAGDFLNAWRYISKKSFLLNKKLEFYEGIIHEDNEFTPRLLYFAKEVIIINNPVYGHLIREGSIMTTYNLKKIDSFILIFQSLKVFREYKVKSREFYKCLNIYLLQMLSNYLQNRNQYQIPQNEDLEKIRKISPIAYDKNFSFRTMVKYLLTRYFPLYYSKYIKFIK